VQRPQNASGGGDSTSAKIAALSPEERAALHARLIARRQQAQSGAVTSPPPSNQSVPPSSNTPTRETSSIPQRNVSINTRTASGGNVNPTPPARDPGSLRTTVTSNNTSANPNPTVQNLRGTASQPRAARGDSLTRYTTPDGTPVLAVEPGSNVTSVGARGLPSRGNNPNNPNNIPERRPSQQVIDKEKKTDYWQDVARAAANTGVPVANDLDSVISRAMSLGVVGDKKTRESMSGPKSNELLQKVALAMEQRVTELGGQKMDNSGPLMDRIMTLEKTLSNLEAKKSKEEEEEKLRVQTKIAELESSLKNLQASKVEQREKNRQTMKLEIDSLKEMMAKVQQENNDAAANNAQVMGSKVARLEAALRLLNEERKKGSDSDDKDSLLLKRKLGLFEQKLKEMEAEKKLREEADNSDALKEKLSLMEDKLAKMEKRKSSSMTQDLQNKMETAEKQLSLLRTERTNGHPDAINNKIAQKMQLLEKHIHDLANQQQRVVVNDPETDAIRGQISRLEDTIVQAERRMEDQKDNRR